MPPDLVCTFFQFISYIFQRKSDKYIQELVDFVFPYKRLIFPPSCPDYPSCRYNREGIYSLIV